VFQGSYSEAMAGAIDAYRAGQRAAICQVQEVGNGDDDVGQGAIKPVQIRSWPTRREVRTKAYVPAVWGTTDTKGQMLSFP